MHLYNKRKSVANQIIGQSSLIVLMGFILFVLIGTWEVRKASEYELRADAARLSKIAQNSLVQPIWHYDQPSIDAICQSFFSNIENASFKVVKVTLYDAGEAKIFDQSLYSEKQIAEVKGDIWESDEIAVSRDGEVIGRFRFWIDTSPIKAAYYKSLTVIFAVLLSLVMVLMVVNYIMLKNLVGRPFGRLLNLANEAFNGNYIHNTDEDKDTEFGVLARAFNRAFFAIHERDVKIKQYTESLELLVNQKSKELDDERMRTVQSSKLTMLGEFAGQIAHEINNPLAVIQGLGQVILATVKTEQADVKSYAEKIVSMTERIAKIIRGVKVYARDGGNDPMAPFSALEMITSAQDMTSHKMQQGKIKFVVKNELQSGRILGREVQITQILVNLISNACDAISGLEDKWIEVWLRENDGKTYISVTDSGAGIPVELRHKILTPFYTTKPVGQGTGLGLSISRQIAQQHSGDLSYDESCANTRFTISLPSVQTMKGAA